MAEASVQQQKRGSLFAGIGALVALTAFLILPYINITLTLASTGYDGSSQAPPTYSQSFAVGTGFITLFSGIIWIEGLLAIAVVVLAGLVMWREAPFGNTESLPVATQLRRASYAIFILGIAAVLFQFLFVTIGNGQISGMMQSASVNGPNGSINIGELLHFGSALSISMGYAIGSWLYLLAMGVVIFGGVQMLKAAGVAFPKVQVQPQFQTGQQPNQYQQQSWQQTGQYAQHPSGQYPLQSGSQYSQQPSAQYPQQSTSQYAQQNGQYAQQQDWQQPIQQDWQQTAQSQQQWQHPSQELPRRQPTQDWQGWQQPPSQ